ncbi:MAG: hypothetical protein HC837_14965 [Chloroflexaceae bacterium]|nr:hypothetical protein [Chloroflexaceae bacterium]
MDDREDMPMSTETLVQLSQVRVPLEQASEVFVTEDASGRIPIVVMTRRQSRIRTAILIVGAALIAASIGSGFVINNVSLTILLIVAGIAVVFMSISTSFYVIIPEGASALLSKRGKYLRTIGSGASVIPPWIFVTHLVTRREIPFDVPVSDAPTADNVRASLDVVITFVISDPYKFVYSISAGDFDHVLQASCQDRLRSLIRSTSADQVLDLVRYDTTELREALTDQVTSYGVTIRRVNIINAQLPAAFLESLEARQLSILQRAEQTERHALAQRRQEDTETLARQEVVARVERDREELRVQVQRAEVRRWVAELEAEAEMLRRSWLDEMLRRYPNVVEYEQKMARLDVARALAGNSRTILQAGNLDEFVRSITVRDLWQESRTPAEHDPQAAEMGQVGPAGDGTSELLQSDGFAPDGQEISAAIIEDADAWASGEQQR